MMIVSVLWIILLGCAARADDELGPPGVVDRSRYGVTFTSRGIVNTGKFSAYRVAFVIRLPEKLQVPPPIDFCESESEYDPFDSSRHPHWLTNISAEMKEQIKREIQESHNKRAAYYNSANLNLGEGSKIIGPRACYNGKLLYGHYLKLS